LNIADKNLKRIRPPLISSLSWCLALRCPSCGQSRIFARPFQLKESCEACRVVFKREEGFFVGAILVAVVSTEALIVLAYLISLPIVAAHYQLVIGVLLVLALLFPIAFFHHSWSIWLSFDHFIEGLPQTSPGSRSSRPQ
jgi:uncharacterized protein (DUF983 family)